MGRRRAAPGSFRPRTLLAAPPTRARADRTKRSAARVDPTRWPRRARSRCAPAFRRRGASASRACAAPRASRRPARAEATRPAARARGSRETTRARRVGRRGTSLTRAPPRGRRRAGNPVPEALDPGRETREGADTAGRRRPEKSRRTSHVRQRSNPGASPRQSCRTRRRVWEKTVPGTPRTRASP